jgi:hypothetical protein
MLKLLRENAPPEVELTFTLRLLNSETLELPHEEVPPEELTCILKPTSIVQMECRYKRNVNMIRRKLQQKKIVAERSKCSQM